MRHKQRKELATDLSAPDQKYNRNSSTYTVTSNSGSNTWISLSETRLSRNGCTKTARNTTRTTPLRLVPPSSRIMSSASSPDAYRDRICRNKRVMCR